MSDGMTEAYRGIKDVITMKIEIPKDTEQVDYYIGKKIIYEGAEVTVIDYKPEINSITIKK